MPKAVQRNAVDLHSSKRVAVLCLDDRDVELMLSMVESGRDPADVVKKEEFRRVHPLIAEVRSQELPDKASAPSDAQAQRFEFLSPMLDSALGEMREFAKKRQDGIVSELKIKVLNRLLTQVKEILANEESVAYARSPV